MCVNGERRCAYVAGPCLTLRPLLDPATKRNRIEQKSVGEGSWVVEQTVNALFSMCVRERERER